MFRRIVTAGVAGAALSIAVPALAAPGGGHGAPGGGIGIGAGGGVNIGGSVGPGQTGMGAGMGGMGSVNASPTGIDHGGVNSGLGATTTTNPATGVSQGPMHASTTGIANANTRSVLAGGAVAGTALPGLTTGLAVQTSTGTTLGKVSKVVTDTKGNIRLVVVTSATGKTYRLAPSTLSISGGVVTTTSATAGG